jgi:hypothetical protein
VPLGFVLDVGVGDGRHGKEADLQLRLGRGIPMYEMALEPVRARLTKSEFHKLVLSLAGASGIEFYIALKDVCELDDKKADDISASIIAAILDRALSRKA